MSDPHGADRHPVAPLMTPTALIVLYNAVLESNGLTRPRTQGIGEVQAARKFLAWCAVEGVDPERWIRARHDAIGYRRRIRLKQMASAKFLPKFMAWGDGKQAAQVAQERIALEVIDLTEADPGVTPLTEAMKRTLADSPEICAVDQELTGGWHPRSEWCRGCRAVDFCKAQLNSRVLRVREAYDDRC